MEHWSNLIAGSVVLLIILFLLYPIPMIVISVTVLVGYTLFISFSRSNTRVSGDALRRRSSLETAQLYLSPYTDIWKNLKLSNKFCTLRLGADGVTITATEKKKQGQPYRTFKIVSSAVHSNSDLWDMFCLNFDHFKTYDGLVDDCKLFKVKILENVIGSQTIGDEAAAAHGKQQSKTPVEKLDINNCSEVELTALPGISIVMSKKVIKKREEIGGFKTVNDFFLFLKLKPHLENQLKDMVCVKKMQGSVKIERYKERSVDL